MQNILDFKNKRVYENRKQKFLDFVVGLIVAIVAVQYFLPKIFSLSGMFGLLDSLSFRGWLLMVSTSGLIGLAIYIIATIFLFRIRRYMAQGMATIIFILPIAYLLVFYNSY